MTCALLDFGCHALQVVSDLWSGLSGASKGLIIIGLLSIAGGGLWGAGKALKAFGGWPAVIGGAAVLAGLVIAVLPQSQPPAAKPQATEFQFGADRVKPKKRRPTIFDREAR